MFLYARRKTGHIMLCRCLSVRLIIRPSGQPGSFTVFRTFFAIFTAIALKLSVSLSVKNYCSSLSFGMINSFLQELYPWNLVEFYFFFSFPDFLSPSLQV
jgi:hypothetical protein